MKRLSLSLSLLLAVLLTCAPMARAAGLTDLEALVDASPEVLPALADMEDALAARDATVAASGVRAFAGAGYAVNNEPKDVGNTDRIYYDRHYGRLGLSLPLLGSWARQRSATMQAEARVLTTRQLLEAQKFSGLAALRKAYIVRWAERQRRACITGYLAQAEQAEAILLERMREGIVLPADHQAFMAAFAQARQLREASLAVEERARGVMRLVTGRDVPPDDMTTPDLPRLVEDRMRVEGFVRDAHPEVLALQDAAARLHDLPDVMALSELGASFDVAYAPTRDIPGTTGDSFTFGINLEMPLGVIEAGEAASARARAVERKARHVATLRREQLLNDLRTAQTSLQAAMSTLEHAERRLDAATEATRASRLRLAALPGDTFEQHIRARHGLLAAALDAIDATAQVMQARAEVLRIATDEGGAFTERRESVAQLPGMDLLLRQASPEAVALALPDTAAQKVPPRREGTAVPSASATPPPASSTDTARKAMAQRGASARQLGVYMWEAAPLLRPASRAATFAEMRSAGVTHVLLSLDAAQMRTVRANKGAPLRTILRTAHQQGIRLSLLLGDPAWMLPEERADLVAIVRELATVPFDGLHLDLEPDQLPHAEGRQAELAGALADTVQTVAQASPWPVSLSVHPRYLAADGPSPWLAARLEQAGVSEVAVMVYTTNRDSVVDTMRALAAAHPRLRLTLAQSVERDQPADTSLHTEGPAALEAWLANIDTALGEHIHGVLIQSWEDYRTVIR